MICNLGLNSFSIAFNDDGGNNFNSLIAINLSPGEYHVRVALYNQNATGAYSLEVSRGAQAVIPQLAVNGAAFNASIAAASESDALNAALLISP